MSVRSTCRRGHSLTVENVYVRGDGVRVCRICTRAAERARWAKSYQHKNRLGPIPTPAIARLWPRVVEVGTCWLVTGSSNALGYGLIHSDGRTVLTHRVMWEALVGPIADGLELDHLCRNPNCCNPRHLEPVTHRENLRRARLDRETATGRFASVDRINQSTNQPQGAIA